ncbi:beta-lactamase family protein [Clostridium sp. DSM 100503]|uniref:serine hydrolase domain-containing protein n=1 Tax=Clostridium sp. DSM 100503 TaxID=2963282 RepID=UPI00214A15BE|nr:serine hydrolase domain-containing protein [Clostridium sp. DSM 100503]MCR1949840.1 beta-lactamase family protein [Clostridium sp. DSM 100503]
MRDKDINRILEKINEINDYSGVVSIKENKNILLKKAFGLADISNNIENTIDTRFGIASGAKLFTAIGICKLIDSKVITFDTLLKDCLDLELPYFDKGVTIHHLLTHTSGIPDYFDENTISNFDELWKKTPMYLLREPKDFIPMFKNSAMMFSPGEKFHYNNAAFIVLALVIENLTKNRFIEFIKENVLDALNMVDSGYYSLDILPKNCAYGYIKNKDGKYKTNIYSIPVIGGGDGGIFVTAEDISKLWDGLLSFNVLSEETTKKLLTPHVHVHNDVYYGYGVWIIKREDKILKYYITGSDPGVAFMSSFYPDTKIEVTSLSNKEFGPYDISMFVESIIENSEK